MTDTDREAVLAATAEAQRGDLETLDAAIRRVGPTLQPAVDRGFFGYGRYHYRYATGRAGDWFALSLVPRKAGLSLYVGAAAVERWADRLPRASCGKGCIRLRRAADMPDDVLAEIVAYAASIDGKVLDWTGRDQRTDPPAIRDAGAG